MHTTYVLTTHNDFSEISLVKVKIGVSDTIIIALK
jgi:hypothetical protein